MQKDVVRKIMETFHTFKFPDCVDDLATTGFINLLCGDVGFGARESPAALG
ncbi:MAG: hypothetical protein HHJ19_16520 [Polaromonas sp.]|nr:hypothetical protein [Polaromonas sp.]